jgi:hypothetical protein
MMAPEVFRKHFEPISGEANKPFDEWAGFTASMSLPC